MRYLFGFVCVLVLSVVPLVGCSETTGAGGDGGSAGAGGTGGMPECGSAEDCDDSNECTGNACVGGMCEYTPLEDGTACDEENECTVGTCAEGVCDSTPVADGTACGDDAGTCQVGSCQVACTEQGIRGAIAAGRGPYTFECGDGMTVMTSTEIAIDNDVILDGEGLLTVDGNDDHRVFSVVEGVTVELRGFTVTGGMVAGEAGSGISNDGDLVLVNTTIRDNTAVEQPPPCIGEPCAGGGPGIYNAGDGTLTLTNSTVSGNSPGGIGQTGGMLTITNSTVSGNSPTAGIRGEGPLTLTNSTVSGNDGGIEFGSGTLTLTNCTVSGNVALHEGKLTWTATLIDGDCQLDEPEVVSNGYNIESNGDTCGFDQSTDMPGLSADDLKLGELADNGGPTKTHALEAGSEAIDVIPQGDCRVTSDQRGELRPETSRGICDVGAFERQPDDQ